MPSAHPTSLALRHQFDTVEQQQEAASLGMWVFIVTEILFFGGLFAVYSIYRSAYGSAFAAASHELHIWLGTINTVVLISSSFTMALAVHAAQTGSRRATSMFLIATMILGTLFLGIKGVEYTKEFAEHHVPGAGFEFAPEHARQAQIFFSLYFVMTGLHALHMIIGIGIMAVLLWMSWRGRFSPEYYTPIEITGLYWHFVDIIWIFLLPLLYLIGRHG